MGWIWMAVYLFFSVVHPVSELIPATSLRKFLNLDYYPTKQSGFPVNRLFGIVGSLLVMVILVLPFFKPDLDWCWYLALGLAFADLIQHAVHFKLGKQKTAPQVHLITIIGVCILLPLILPYSKLDFSDRVSWGWMIAGALIIFINWGQNSLRVKLSSARAPQPV